MSTSMPLIALELPFLPNLNFVLTYFQKGRFSFFFFLQCFIISNDVISRDLFLHSVLLFICIFSLLFGQMYRASFGLMTSYGQ